MSGARRLAEVCLDEISRRSCSANEPCELLAFEHGSGYAARSKSVPDRKELPDVACQRLRQWVNWLTHGNQDDGVHVGLEPFLAGEDVPQRDGTVIDRRNGGSGNEFHTEG